MDRIGAAQWKWLAAAAAGAAIATLAPLAAQAATTCERWDISGKWSAIQDNNSRADFNVTQGDTLIQGTAAFTNKWTRNGNFDGTLSGSNVNFTVYWNVYNNGVNEIGQYTGTISPTGRVTGTTFDKYHPETKVPWYSSRAMGCSHWVTSSAPPTAPAKPGLVLGRTQAPAGAASGQPMTICQRAEDAATRGAPTYEALKRQCLAQH